VHVDLDLGANPLHLLEAGRQAVVECEHSRAAPCEAADRWTEQGVLQLVRAALPKLKPCVGSFAISMRF
jgi:hypothetical protein